MVATNEFRGNGARSGPRSGGPSGGCYRGPANACCGACPLTTSSGRGRPTNRLEGDPALRLRWQSRFTHVCVDEFQDVDAAQLRLVRLLAAPEDNLFVVGDHDQS